MTTNEPVASTGSRFVISAGVTLKSISANPIAIANETVIWPRVISFPELPEERERPCLQGLGAQLRQAAGRILGAEELEEVGKQLRLLHAGLFQTFRGLGRHQSWGVGVTDATEADYYEIKGNPMLNTFSPDQVKMLQQGQSESVVERVRKMPLININRLIAEQLGKAPDVLSTDIEGLDYDIIRSLDLSRFRPGAICAETVAMSAAGANSDITTYLLAQGYVVRGGSTINTIYVDSKRLPA